MLKNILVPLDGSPLAEAALPYADALARRAGANLVLVRAAHHTSVFNDPGADQMRVVSQAKDYLNLLADDMRAHGFNVQTAVPFGGSPAAWIVEESEMRHVDLIVMATHDRIGPDRWVHGSVAEAVVQRSTAPVMLVRVSDTEQRVQAFEAQQPVLIVPLDGSELADSALPIARELAQVLNARVVLIAVVSKPGQLVAGQGSAIATYVGSDYAKLEAEAVAYLDASMARIGRVGGSVERVLRYGDAASEIAAAANDYETAAVVMATHGRTGVVRSILGSVAGGVLHHSSYPVVLIHPPELRGAEEPIPNQLAAAPAD